ncbi:hypothetical protein Ahy_A09g043745 [Arachis hypogaea]|uniref:Uncharacterized protein n=1 Tax=Arachis hypogaea TaxID=3818 RepID=A0A445BIY1_ARAHY|nr:hypothetical protein Ahy_A09g043745 [Arachis hypogaea]
MNEKFPGCGLTVKHIRNKHKRLKEKNTECFIPSFPESKLANSFDLASKLSVQPAMSSLPLIWKLK